MAEGIKPIRRVVTGNDAQGPIARGVRQRRARCKSECLFKKGTNMTDIWQFDPVPRH